MTDKDDIIRWVVDIDQLPENYPTNYHDAKFWEALGRAIATYGFLEEVLTKAIFAFTATRQYTREEVEKEYEPWIKRLKCSLSDSLGSLIDTYQKAVKDNPDTITTNLDDLVRDLREAAERRNVLAHGFWQKPDVSGKSLPKYIKRKGLIFDTPVDINDLNQVQKHVAELACSVVSTVTSMGWQFPGTSGHGKPIM